MRVFADAMSVRKASIAANAGHDGNRKAFLNQYRALFDMRLQECANPRPVQIGCRITQLIGITSTFRHMFRKATAIISTGCSIQCAIGQSAKR